MGFEGYKLRHKLVVFHHLRDEQDPVFSHAKTYELLLYVSIPKKGFLRFDEIEKVIEKRLAPYTRRVLSEVPPFDHIELLLENIANVIYQLLEESLGEKGVKLERLEVSENPIKTCVVNEENVNRQLLVGEKKTKLSNLLIQNIVSQSTSKILGESEEPEQTLVEVVPAPEPEEEAPAPPALPKEKPFLERNPLTERRAPLYQVLLGAVCLLATGACFALYLAHTGVYPSGSDTFGHLFKSDLLYHSIKSGDLFPLYTSYWYNGMQPFRYWAPVPYYILALMQFFAGGDAISSYYLFMFFSYIVGGGGWLIWGATYNRIPFCTFLGGLWFFLPDNIRVFFSEGNLPRMVITMLLPYIFYFIWRFVEYRKRKAILFVVLFMCVMVLCHVMISAMVGIATFIFLFLYSVNRKRVRESFFVIAAMLLSFAVCGFWLFPALQGGLINMDPEATGEVMKALSTPFTVSLNPFLRNRGGSEWFYFGLSILALSIAGVFLSSKRNRPGFYTVIIVFCGTTTAMVTFLEKLPLNQLLWMTRFTPIVYAIFLLSVLEWRESRRYAAVLIALVLVLDCLPTADLQRYHSQTPYVTAPSLHAAKEITEQRLSLMDVSSLGSYPSYMIAAEQPQVPYTFGWAWQGASTSHNIVMVNTSLERGYYHYLFDRSLELGDDTVAVSKEQVAKANKNLSLLTEGAEASGYSLYKETNYTYIYHKDTPKTFGLKTKYQGLTIGASANMLTFEYPAFEEGYSNELTDYTFKELNRYKVIYLSGFTYSDRAVAEKLLLRLSEAGTKIIIDMNRIPVDPLTSRMIFFDVTAQSISFSQRYPELMYRNKVYESLPFKAEYSIWNTVYLENLDHVDGYSWFKSKRLAFLGYTKNKNLIMMGYNFLFHAMETDDESIRSLMSEVMELKPNQLPQRSVLPIAVRYEGDTMTIQSPGGKISTTIAYQDNFQSPQKIESKQNLLVVNESKTVIDMVYPYLVEGLAVSAAGLLGIAGILYLIYRKRGVSS